MKHADYTTNNIFHIILTNDLCIYLVFWSKIGYCTYLYLLLIKISVHNLEKNRYSANFGFKV